MGAVDHIKAKCPKCSEDLYGQTKSGYGEHVIESEMDADEASMVSNEELVCSNGHVFIVKVGEIPKVKVTLEEKVLKDPTPMDKVLEDLFKSNGDNWKPLATMKEECCKCYYQDPLTKCNCRCHQRY